MQTELFGYQGKVSNGYVNPSSNKTKWSYSKRSLFETCLRRYYYHYYTEAAKKLIGNSAIESLKALSTKEVVFGNIIHWIISCSLRGAKNGEEWDEERIISFGQKMVDDSILKSNRVPDLAGTKNNQNFIMEVAFGEEKPEVIRDQGFARVETCVQNLFESDEFIKIYEGGKVTDSLVESNTNFKLNETITVYGQLDIAYYEQYGFRIVDWKTGEDLVEGSSLQLAIYALWANRKLSLKAEDIEISKAYLATDRFENFVFNATELERATARIIQDAYRIDELHQFAQTGQVDAFDMCESKKVCSGCSFNRICYER